MRKQRLEDLIIKILKKEKKGLSSSMIHILTGAPKRDVFEKLKILEKYGIVKKRIKKEKFYRQAEDGSIKLHKTMKVGHYKLNED